jgi:RNA polymerase primary sigma factor
MFNEKILDELNPTVDDIQMMQDIIEFCEDIEEDVEEDTYTGDSMQWYLKKIGRIKRLTLEEELELGKEIKEGGSNAIDARNKLIEANLRLVMHYAKKYLGRGVDLEDLNAMGTEGLFKAVQKYDYVLGYRFSTYASWWINQAITRGITAESSTVRIPVHMSEAIHKVRKAQKTFKQETGNEPTIEEVVEISGLPEKTVMAAIQAMYTTVSFDTKVGEDGESTLEDFLADDRAEDPCESMVKKDLQEAVKTVLGMLEPREAFVLSRRIGLGGAEIMTLEEIAKLPGFGVTRERIRQIEGKALRKIRTNPKMRNVLKDFAA